MHWTDVVAERLLKRGSRHRVASGTSISGLIHLGNAGDVIYADGIARAVRAQGGTAEVLWIADDVDPLRSVPEQLPPGFSEHLGKPVAALPDPDGCHAAFTDHFIEPFLASLRSVGVEPVEKRGSRMYAAGEYDKAVRIALEKSEAIRDILVRVAKSKKAAGWLPFDPICDNCGKIAATDALGLEGKGVRYRCAGGVAGKREIAGCGHEGVASLRHGKLTWRVEWAARWQILGVTCEPFGKEHSAAGGSYDTSKVITKEIFGYGPPEPVLYEHILVGGAKMSKSKGNVIALSQLLEVLPPEAVRYFYFRVDPNKHQDFDPKAKLLPLVEEYERIQAIALGQVAPSGREDVDEIKRIYALAQVDSAAPAPFDEVPFNHLITLAQVAPDTAGALEVLRRSSFGLPSDPAGQERLRQRAESARRFLSRWIPEEERFSVVPQATQLPHELLDARSKAYLAILAEQLKKTAWEPQAIHNAVFEAAKHAGLEGKEGFRAVYLALIGKERGPRAGYFLSSLEKPFVIERFREVAAAK